MQIITEFRSEELPEDVRGRVAKRPGPVVTA